MLRFHLSGLFLDGQGIVERGREVADESYFLDEAVGGLALCGLRWRFGFLGLLRLRVLLLERVEGVARCCFR